MSDREDIAAGIDRLLAEKPLAGSTEQMGQWLSLKRKLKDMRDQFADTDGDSNERTD